MYQYKKKKEKCRYLYKIEEIILIINGLMKYKNIFK